MKIFATTPTGLREVPATIQPAVPVANDRAPWGDGFKQAWPLLELYRETIEEEKEQHFCNYCIVIPVVMAKKGKALTATASGNTRCYKYNPAPFGATPHWHENFYHHPCKAAGGTCHHSTGGTLANARAPWDDSFKCDSCVKRV